MFAYVAVGATTAYMIARTRFLIEELEVVGDFVLFLEIESLERLMNMIDKINENYHGE